MTKPTDEEQHERAILENHAADVQNGLSETAASESDAFERRVLGLPDEDEDEDYSSPPMRNGRCTRCKRTAAYCEC